MLADSLLLKAKQGKLEIIEVMAEAEKIAAAGQRDQAIALYRKWIGHTDSPLVYAACFNLGVALSESGELIEAEKAYRQAISFNPDFIQARFNLGSALERQGRFDEALDEWRVILALEDSVLSSEKNIHLMALNNLGRLLEIVKNYKEAELMLEISLTLEPKQPDVISHWVHLRQKQCQWPIYKHPAGLSMESMIKGTSAIAMLSATNDPQQQLDTAIAFVESKVVADAHIMSDKSGYHHKRLRIGYISSDFRTHAVSLLTVELFELHDRSKFEIYGFCSTPQDTSPLRLRVIKAMDHFVRIADMSDEEAARSIRSHEIDILVDLQGLTSGLRPNIFKYRPAPVQITYLGFPGTTGLPGIDYVLADRFIIPEKETSFFTEKPLYMPHVFQVSDRQRKVGIKPSRSSCNLPDDAFVFCSFNNNYKITEEMFACWIRILKRVDVLENSPRSVLWLLADNKWAQENMTKAALQHGVSADRIVFASRVAPVDYLARYQVADLFLDTFPFNAGTTANDALWMGLPILTLSGRTFASRMAGSLLNSVGLPELITCTLQDYEDKAVNLASDWYENRTSNELEYLDNQCEKKACKQSKIANLRRHIQDNLSTCRLFDLPQLVRDIEGLFEEVAVRFTGSSDHVTLLDKQEAVFDRQNKLINILPKNIKPELTRIVNFNNKTSWGIRDVPRFVELMNEVVELVEPGFYFSDNLFTWGRNNSLNDDAAFQNAWLTNIKNESDFTISWRRYLLACSAYQCVQLPGDFVECGVYWGTGIKTVIDYLGGKKFPKIFWGYDTYDYHPEEGHAEFTDQKEGFFDQVQERFNGYEQVKLIKGLLPESFIGNCPKEIAYLHIDLNSAKYEIAVLDALFDLVVRGGIIILDDYEWAGIYRTQKIVEDEWFDARRYRVMPLPTGQGLVIKR